MDKDKIFEIKKLQKDINAKFGEGALTFGIDIEESKPMYISSGSLIADLAIGGGFRRGWFTQIYGPPKGGKTSFALCAVAAAQAEGLTVAYLDPEPIDAIYAESLGVNIDTLIRSKSEKELTAEQWMQITRQLITDVRVDFIVIDSVAGLVPRQETEGSVKENKDGTKEAKEKTLEDVSVAALARVMSMALRILNRDMNQRKGLKPAVLLVNQIRTNIGVKFGNPEIRPGGHALGYYSSVTVRVSKVGKVEIEEDQFDSEKGAMVKGKKQIGFRSKFKVVEGRIAIPREQVVTFYTDGGVNVVEELFVKGIVDGSIVKDGSKFRFKDEKEKYWKADLLTEIAQRKQVKLIATDAETEDVGQDGE